MNVNSLANAMKPAVLPGEELRVRVIQEGKEAGQGVGFLDDGTMIVVEGGARHLDREIEVGGHARAPDGRRADDLRPAARRVSGRVDAVRRRRAIVVAADRARGWAASDKLAALVGGPAAARLDAGRPGRARRASRRIVVVTAAANASPRSRPRPGSRTRLGRGRRGRTAPGLGRRGRRPRSADGRPDDVVLVHDGARPLVSAELVDAVAGGRRRARRGDPGRAGGRDPQAGRGRRSRRRPSTAPALVAAQTPQGVRRDVLAARLGRSAARRPATWTDEAALLEACRIPVHAVPGESANLKVTLPDDLARVEAALRCARGDRRRRRRPRSRVGFGDDGHPFGPGAPLALGGLADRRRPRASTATRTATWRSMRSATRCSARPGSATSAASSRPGRPRRPGSPAGELLQRASRGCAAAGYAPVCVDVTIIGARPRLAGQPDAMARRDRRPASGSPPTA